MFNPLLLARMPGSATRPSRPASAAAFLVEVLGCYATSSPRHGYTLRRNEAYKLALSRSEWLAHAPERRHCIHAKEDEHHGRRTILIIVLVIVLLGGGYGYRSGWYGGGGPGIGGGNLLWVVVVVIVLLVVFGGYGHYNNWGW